VKYFIAVAFVWFGCAIAWMILGSTLVYRSGEMSGELTQEVDGLWGPPLTQRPPRALYRETRKQKEKVRTTNDHGVSVETEVERDVEQQIPVPLTASDIDTRLELEHRRKGLLWFATYTTTFAARYEFHNDSQTRREVELTFPLNVENAVYDGFAVADASGARLPVAIDQGNAQWKHPLGAGERVSFEVRYRSRGRSEWRYQLTEGTGRVERFDLSLTTNFGDVDFPAGTLSPTKHSATAGGWRGEWKFDSLVASAPIGVELPQKLNPGPLASRITFFAPVGLLFFVFVVAVLAAARRQPLHPMHYFFFGCAFFAFHLLFAYLVDHVAIAGSFAIASAVSLLLVVTYARLFMGWRRALYVLALPQLVYLVLFSATFFFAGYTGLAITVGAIVTLFLVMQTTGRVVWGATLAAQPQPAVSP
jgi:hypothetical protein